MTSNRSKSPCPVNVIEYPRILLAHGGGGRLMYNLIHEMFSETFKNPFLETNHDGARLDLNSHKLVFTTDSYVIHPLFFPGGDIGKLAVYGTVNDLAMCGAKPEYISISFILEEGLLMEDLWRICLSIRDASIETDTYIVTGDTKVVEKGKGDQIYINTSGIGSVYTDKKISPDNIRPNDKVIVNGDIGRHGVAVMTKREGISFETNVNSDCAPLNKTVMELLGAGIDIHCMRDLTRGGLGTALVEISNSCGLQVMIYEKQIPVLREVNGVCQLLGLDPVYVANEGRFVMFVPESDTEQSLEIIKISNPDFDPFVIGEVTDIHDKLVVMENKIGTRRIIDMPSGQQLPRIC